MLAAGDRAAVALFTAGFTHKAEERTLVLQESTCSVKRGCNILPGLASGESGISVGPKLEASAQPDTSLMYRLRQRYGRRVVGISIHVRLPTAVLPELTLYLKAI